MRALALCLGLCLASWLQAAPPVVNAVYPAGSQRGSVEIELVGKVAYDKLQFWSSHPGITFEVAEEKGLLHIADDCPHGNHWLRFYNEEGSALPVIYRVIPSETQEEEEPNNTIATANAVKDDVVTLNGRLHKTGEVDTFAVTLREGATFVAEAFAYRLDSPVDSLLRIVDASGNQLSWNHDRFDSLDPRLEFVAPASGTYYLTIAGFVYPPAARSQFQGSAESVYQLHVIQETRIPGQTFSQSQGRLEEPALPGVVEGVISMDALEQVYNLEAVKDQFYEIKANGAPLNSPLDAWIEVRDAEGKVLAKNDDQEGFDSGLSWKAPQDGSHVIAIRDLLRRGGDDYHYQLSVEASSPSFEVTVSAHAWTIKGGGTLEIPVAVKRRHGHTKPITVSLEGLPSGLENASLTLSEKEKEGVLKLEAPESLGASTTMIQLRSTDGDLSEAVQFPFKGATTDQGALLKNDLEDFLLVVQPKD